MLYNMFLANNAYLCNVKRKKYRITRCLTAPETREHKPRRSRNAGAQTKTIMEKNVNEILKLQYRIKRYQAMRNGAMCQLLNGKLQKLLAQQASAL